MIFLSVAQVAERLRVSAALVYGWCHAGLLAHMRLGRKGKRGTIRIAEADLDAFLASRRGEVRQEAAPPRPRGKKDGDFTSYYHKVMDEVARKAERRKHR